MKVKNFIGKNGGKYNDKVIEYCQICVNTVLTDPSFKTNFQKYDVSVEEFLNLLLRKSQENLEVKGSEALDKKQFDKVFQNVVFYNEMSHFILDDTEHIKCASIDKFGNIEYKFDKYAIQFFKDKYKIDLSNYNRS